MVQIALDPVTNKTGNIWHLEINDLDLSNLHYGWRADGDQSWEGTGHGRVQAEEWGRRR
jgi:hypothetical protein